MSCCRSCTGAGCALQWQPWGQSLSPRPGWTVQVLNSPLPLWSGSSCLGAYPDSPVPGSMFLLAGKWPRSQCPWQQEDRRLLQQREELPDTWMQECSGDGDAACRGMECLLLALPLPRSFLRHSQFIYPFVPHLMLAVVQSITTSTQRGWQCWWCFVRAGSSLCFMSVLCSRVAGVACCISLQGSTAQVADAFPCLRSRKARAPRMENSASNPDNAGSSCVAEEEEVGRAPLRTATEATCCFTPRHHMLS